MYFAQCSYVAGKSHRSAYTRYRILDPESSVLGETNQPAYRKGKTMKQYLKDVIRNLAFYGGLVIGSWTIIIGIGVGLYWLFITVRGI